MPEGRQPCRCLLDDSRPDLQQVVRDVLSSVPEEKKAADDVIRRRLDACLSCSFLRDGTCAACGCYVEIRAAMRQASCPDVPPKWTAC